MYIRKLDHFFESAAASHRLPGKRTMLTAVIAVSLLFNLGVLIGIISAWEWIAPYLLGLVLIIALATQFSCAMTLARQQIEEIRAQLHTRSDP